MTDPWDMTATVDKRANGSAAPPAPDPTQAPWEEEPDFRRPLPTAYTFDFGKHKGRAIEIVPEGYVSWCLENIDRLNPGHPRFQLSLWEIFRHRLGLPMDQLAMKNIKLACKMREKVVRAEAKDVASVTSRGLSDGLRKAVKAWYLTLSRRYHPDLGGGTSEQQAVVNACYTELIQILDKWEGKK